MTAPPPAAIESHRRPQKNPLIGPDPRAGTHKGDSQRGENVIQALH